MKTLSLLFTAILLSCTSFAQDSRFEFGLQAGPNITYMRYGSYTTQSNRSTQLGATAGLFFQYNINTVFSLRTDPGYERLSESDKIIFTDQAGSAIGTGKIYLHYNYISVPVLIRASIGNKLRYFINAGPCLGFLFNQTTTSDWPNDPKKNNTAYYQTLNFGITSGIGVAVPLKEKFSFSVEVRNNLGLTNIRVSSNSNSAIRTTATSLLIGFSYKLGKGNILSTAPKKKEFSPTF